MLQQGTILSGKYRIDGVLGEGGMAVVYAVTHLRNTARLAVKVLHADSVLKRHVRARFMREGKVANSVKHPGAVTMHDDGVAEDGSPYLVMEYLDGFSVDDIGARGMPLGAALNIAYQVLDVLRAAHANGIIHRDIKPANLFLLRDGRVKVLDFGISRLRDGAEPFDSSATFGVMGTPLFMAPEQARAVTLEVDPRTDLFAVGATLFTLISGKFLYTGDESAEVMREAATRQARSLGSVAPGTPQAVIDLVAKALAYDSAARWESAEAMQDAVRQVHEALCGPIAFEALARLVLTREFRRKSHAKLTGPVRRFASPSSSSAPSPLSTTLPAMADVTRSRESFREARISQSDSEAPSARLSVGPPELAGWTGQVLVKLDQAPGATTHVGSRFGQSFERARVLRVGALLAAMFGVFFGLSRHQNEPRAAAARPVIADVSPPVQSEPAAVTSPDTLTSVVPSPPPARPSARERARVRPSPRPPGGAPAPAPTPALTAPAEPWKDAAPTLVRLQNHSP